MLTRRQLFQSALASTAALLPAAQKRPNILFLFTDDQRFDTIRALGNSEVQTPNMDRLVARGTAFTHACIMGGSVPAVCMPSRAMWMTGQSLWHVHDSIIAPKTAPESRKKPFHLFPQELAKAGYKTFGVGKWHNGPTLYNQAFTAGDNVFFGGMSDQSKVQVSRYDVVGKYDVSARRTGEKFSSELFADSAVQFLESNKSSSDPFLLYVAFTSPHDPRMAPQKFADMYSPEKTAVPASYLPEHPFDNGEMKVRDELLEKFPRTKEAIQGHLAGYYAMVTEVDAQIGRVLDALDKSGKADDTIVIFTADNGLAVGRHGLMGKQNLYDHSIRVPLVIVGPGVPKKKRIDSLVYLSDLFPTICDMTVLKTPGTVEGKSLMPLMQGKQKAVRESVYAAYRQVQRAVRTERWKLIEYNVAGKRTTQLFDLQKDPNEMQNLAASEDSRVQELRGLLKKWMKEVDDPLNLDLPDWGRSA